MEAFTFPDDYVDPRKKSKEWILQYIKAAYNTSKGNSSPYFRANDMNEVRAYANGMPSVDKYKKQRTGKEGGKDDWEVIDYSPVDYLSKIRNIVVAKICQRSLDVQCFAVDALSKSEEDNYFNEMKVKIEMRELAMKQGSGLADSPVLRAAPNEPQDMEQLQMEKEFGYKHKLSMEAELGIQLIQQQNNFEEKRKFTIENIVDFGIGGYVNYIDHNGNVKTRDVEPRNLGLSPCQKADFSDLTYWFEVTEVYVGDLAPYFTPIELKAICEASKGQNGNPVEFNYNDLSWQRHAKVYVIDCKFFSWNTTAYEERTDKDNNMRFGKTDFKYLPSQSLPQSPAETIDVPTDANIEGVTRKVVYKGKWIFNTEHVYDYGLSENMVRKESSWWDTSLDIQLRAINFDKMIFQGLTKRLKPFQDQINLIWYRMQNLAAKLIPYIITLDMTALEGVAYGKGGEANNPKNITEFLFSNFVALTRSSNLISQGNHQPIKPVSIDPSGQLYVFGEMRTQLLNNVEQMKQVAGLNDITDASTPNAKTLTTGYQMADQGTNNALYNIQKADEMLIVANADNSIMKLQIATKLGKVQGYVRSLGQDTVKFLEINPDVSLREFGIFAQVMPSYEERQMLWQDVSAKESQGILDVTDKELIMSCRNLKMAMKVLGYRIKKRKEEMQAFEMQKQQQIIDGQVQLQVVGEQEKQKTIGLQLQADIQKIVVEKQLEFKIELMKKTHDLQGEMLQSQGRLDVGQIMAEAKVISSHISAEASKEKQEISNKKSKTKTAA